MKRGKKISIFFVALSVSIILMHSVIPHHHHESFEPHTSCNHDHRHDAPAEKCGLTDFYLHDSTDQLCNACHLLIDSFPKITSFYHCLITTVAIDDYLHQENPQLFIYTNPLIKQLYFLRSLSLRAPPISFS